jgi:hypothetical protein
LSQPYLCTVSSRGRSPPLRLHSHARPPPLCSTALYHRGPIGTSRLRPLPGPDAASPSSTFTPRCSSPSPPVPSTTSPYSRRPFPSTAVPLRAHRQPAAPAIFRPRPSLREHHSALEYIGTVSTLDFQRFSIPSPALPYANHHHHREPSSGEPSPRLTL